MTDYPREKQDRGPSAVKLDRPEWEEGRDPAEEQVREEQRLSGSQVRPRRPGTEWRLTIGGEAMNRERMGSTAPEAERQPEGAEGQRGGTRVYSAEELETAIRGAGVPDTDAREVAEVVGSSVGPGTTWQEIDARVRTLLRLRNPEWEQMWITSHPESRKLWMPKTGDVKTIEDLEPNR